MAVPAHPRTRLRAGAALIGILALAVVAEREHWFGRLRTAAAPRRLWIWTSDPPRASRPLAFLAARDFEVGTVPASARLSVIGDPEYVVWINRQRVGSGAYAAGQPWDVFEVAPLLQRGRNRVVLDLRSATGSGGASLRLEDERGRELVASDDRWYVYRRDWPGLLRGAKLFPTERAAVLGAAPIGRWELPARGPLRPRFGDVQADPVVGATRVRRGADAPWRSLRGQRRSKRPLGGRVELDFGRPVEGYLHLRLRGDRHGLGLLRFGDRPGAEDRWPPDAIAVPLARRGFWQDVTPRRFRYVEVVGLPEVTGAAVIRIAPAAWAALAPGASQPGLLGIRPDPVRLPVVDETWKRWERQPVLRAGPAKVRNDGAARTPARPRARGARRSPGTS
jgi:hypothetical protein